MVFLPQYVWERPVAESVDFKQLALAVENFLTPFARKA